MKVQSPIAGGLRGSAGNIIFQHYHSKNIGRAMPISYHVTMSPIRNAVQGKYASVKEQLTPLFIEMSQYIPDTMRKGANVYDAISSGVFKALNTYAQNPDQRPPARFGFDKRKRIRLYLGKYEVYYEPPYYYVTFWDYKIESKLDFVPTLVHGLYFSSNFQMLEYFVTDFNPDYLCIPINRFNGWFPLGNVELFIAVSNDEFFSDFFY